MKINISEQYLNIPVYSHECNKDYPRLLLKDKSGKIVRYFDFIPAFSQPDFIAFYNVSEFIGQSLELELCGDGNLEEIAQIIKQSNTPMGLKELYNEANRPQLHFSSRRGWLNDPNGLFYNNNTWHMFYQHNPFGCQWGNMHWGHAVSNDLIHWQENDDVLYQDNLGMMFSGGAVVDLNNTSGLQQGSEPPVILFYTASGAHAPVPTEYTQCMAYSTDGGATFTKYEKNPIIPHIGDRNRDPKVIPYNDHWIMALYIQKIGDLHEFYLLKSTNLIDWSCIQKVYLPGSGECPEFFELSVDGDQSNTKWVFIAADGKYLIGNFDGMEFKPESKPQDIWLRQEGIATLYAAQTWSNAPDGRRIIIGWQQGNLPAKEFNMSMSIPLELSLQTCGKEIRLCAEPVQEFYNLIDKELIDIANCDFPLYADILEQLKSVKNELLYIELKVQPKSQCCINLNGDDMIFDSQAGEIRYKGLIRQIWEAQNNGTFDVKIIVGNTWVDIFTSSGRENISTQAIYDLNKSGIYINCQTGKLNHLKISTLKSIWNK